MIPLLHNFFLIPININYINIVVRSSYLCPFVLLDALNLTHVFTSQKMSGACCFVYYNFMFKTRQIFASIDCELLLGINLSIEICITTDDRAKEKHTHKGHTDQVYLSPNILERNKLSDYYTDYVMRYWTYVLYKYVYYSTIPIAKCNVIGILFSCNIGWWRWLWVINVVRLV